MFHSTRWQMVSIFVAFVLLSTGGLGIYVLHLITDNYLGTLTSQLFGQAQLVTYAVRPLLAAREPQGMDALVRELGEKANVRISVIDTNGTVLGDSENSGGTMENQKDLPEIVEAISGGTGTDIRYSPAHGHDVLHVAVPVMIDGGLRGLVRVSTSLAIMDEYIRSIRLGIAAAIAIALAAGILVALQLPKVMARPLKLLTAMSQRIAQGGYDQKTEIASKDEVGVLAASLNEMADKLKGTVNMLTGERDKMAAILSTISDGLIIVDSNRRITMVNKTAERMLRISRGQALGQSFIEAVRAHELDEMLRSCSKDGEKQSKLVEIGPRRQFLGAVAIPLASEPGCLLLLQDLTELHRLETVRRDFVSNISHELRTPIASLKILAESLQEGASSDPSVAQDFLQRIQTETDKMAQMVSELSDLSQMESGAIPLRLEPVDPGQVIEQAAERLRAQAARGELALKTIVPAGLPAAHADKERIEQVLVNLIQNAIKFTPPGGRITVSATSDSASITVTVTDTGVGIPADDLPRVFERFYKADKARAGGGTGLGLAIARHIIEAHRGRIWAESVEGKGSVFIFTLPIAAGQQPPDS